MSLFSVFFGLMIILKTATSTTGCSDSSCSCHPDDECDPGYAKNNGCHSDTHNCYGPVIGTMFEIPLNKSIASSLLPPGLQLGSQPGSWPYPSEWPIKFFFAQQHNVGKNSYNYLEFFLMVTYVEFNDSFATKYKYRGPYSYITQLYLDKYNPTIIGQKCGLNQNQVNITQSCDNSGNCQYYINKNNSNEQILFANWIPYAWNGAYISAPQIPNFWKYQKPDFDLPVISKYPVETGGYQCNIINWYLNTALIQPVFGGFTISEDFYGLLPTGSFRIGNSIMNSPWLGGYRLQTMGMMYNQNQNGKCNQQKGTCSNFEPNTTTIYI